jgi:hypothetical protein
MNDPANSRLDGGIVGTEAKKAATDATPAATSLDRSYSTAHIGA